MMSPATVVMIALSLCAPLLAVWRWRGGWRVAPAVPVVGIVWLVVSMIAAFFSQTDSHTLWKLTILAAGLMGLLYVGGLWLLRYIFGAG